MENVQWNPIKNEHLKFTRGVGFEDILRCRLVDVIDHPTKPNQKISLWDREGYIWVVPYVENHGVIFFKTLHPSRKHTKIYKRKASDHEKN